MRTLFAVFSALLSTVASTSCGEATKDARRPAQREGTDAAALASTGDKDHIPSSAGPSIAAPRSAADQLRALVGRDLSNEDLDRALLGLSVREFGQPAAGPQSADRFRAPAATDDPIENPPDKYWNGWHVPDEEKASEFDAVLAKLPQPVKTSLILSEKAYRLMTVHDGDDRLDPGMMEEVLLKGTLPPVPSGAALPPATATGVVESFTAELAVAGAVGLLIAAPDEDLRRLPTRPTLRSRFTLCSDQSFLDELSVEHNCTAVLVRKDIIATARHCVPDDPSSLVIIFDYRNGRTSAPGAPIPKNDIYRVDSTIKDHQPQDWALLRLDRHVIGRNPITIRPPKPNTPYLTTGEWVFAVGHPDGLPLKFSREGYVAETNFSAGRFVTNLDLFYGNSGSPIFDRVDLAERKMIGLVLLGKRDYIPRPDATCQEVFRCNSADGCEPREFALRADILYRALLGL